MWITSCSCKFSWYFAVNCTVLVMWLVVMWDVHKSHEHWRSNFSGMKSSTAFPFHWWMTSHVFIQKMHYSLTSCQFYYLVPLSSSCTPLGIDSSSRVVDHISTIILSSHFHWKCLTTSCNAHTHTCSISKVHAVQYDYNLNSVCMCENINTLLLYLFNNAKYYMWIYAGPLGKEKCGCCRVLSFTDGNQLDWLFVWSQQGHQNRVIPFPPTLSSFFCQLLSIGGPLCMQNLGSPLLRFQRRQRLITPNNAINDHVYRTSS